MSSVKFNVPEGTSANMVRMIVTNWISIDSESDVEGDYNVPMGTRRVRYITDHTEELIAVCPETVDMDDLDESWCGTYDDDEIVAAYKVTLEKTDGRCAHYAVELI
jgi:hypothetical protein